MILSCTQFFMSIDFDLVNNQNQSFANESIWSSNYFLNLFHSNHLFCRIPIWSSLWLFVLLAESLAKRFWSSISCLRNDSIQVSVVLLMICWTSVLFVGSQLKTREIPVRAVDFVNIQRARMTLASFFKARPDFKCRFSDCIALNPWLSDCSASRIR